MNVSDQTPLERFLKNPMQWFVITIYYMFDRGLHEQFAHECV